jgi:anti-sigma B factor antagonist
MVDEAVRLRVDLVDTGAAERTVFRLTGDLDLSSVDQLRSTVGPAGGSGQEVLLDLADLKFCDSTGVGAMVWLHRRAIASGGRIVLVAPRRHVREVLKISGVDRAIPVRGRDGLALTRPRSEPAPEDKSPA